MIKRVKDKETAQDLFAGWEDTMIWSCLQGVMGHIYGADMGMPGEPLKSAMAVLGDFSFLAGAPDGELVCFWPEESQRDFRILVPRERDWDGLIEAIYRERAVKVTRYATKKERDIFDTGALKRIAEEIPPGYELRMIDEELFERCRREAWCRDLVSGYENYERYEKSGLGVATIKEGAIVSGASSYSSYLGGIEIEIDTKEEFRRRGLAAACGARLILECLERGWYPSWDAQNKISLALAQKLGYSFDCAYTAYEIRGEGE